MIFYCVEGCRCDMEKSENSVPLLSKKRNCRDECPGCKVEKLKETRRGYPAKELILIGLVVLCSSLPITSIFPFLYFMVRDFQVTEPEDIGYYAGYLGSAFMFGRFLSSVPWGIAADKYGRKPVMIVCIFATFVFNILFGLSINFWMALVMRFILGLFNGLLGPVRAYASEICREEHQAFGLSIVGTMWGVGLVIGPALGGFLSQPAEKFPHIFSSSFFGRFPYFLPCLAISIVSFAVFVAIFWLPETIHYYHPGSSEETTNGKADGDDVLGKLKEEGTQKRLLRNWPAMSSIIIYCVFALHDIAYSEVFNLWAVSPKEYGGLNFTTSNVGIVLSITGIGLLFFQLLCFAPLANFAGPILITRIPIAITIPILVLHPFIAILSGAALWISVNFASLVKNILGVLTCTGTYLLLNNSVPQSQRGAANGIALTGMSFFKTLGPSVGGSLFAWAEKRQAASFLPGSHMVFFVLNIIALVPFLMTFEPFLPKSTNKAYSESEDVTDTEQNVQ